MIFGSAANQFGQVLSTIDGVEAFPKSLAWSKTWLDAIVDGKSVRDHIAIIVMDEDVFCPNQKCARLQIVSTRPNHSVMSKAKAEVKFGSKNGTMCTGSNMSAATCGQVLAEISTGKGQDDLAKLLSTEQARTVHTSKRTKRNIYLAVSASDLNDPG